MMSPLVPPRLPPLPRLLSLMVAALPVSLSFYEVAATAAVQTEAEAAEGVQADDGRLQYGCIELASATGSRLWWQVLLVPGVYAVC